MLNHKQNFEAAVKDELHKAARANGVDPAMVGFDVSSSFGPVQVSETQQMMAPVWLLVVTLRVELVGTPPVAIPTMIPYLMTQAGTLHLPSESDFRGATRQALDVALQAREQLMHPETVPGAVPGQVIR
jgi:hypothetical protein